MKRIVSTLGIVAVSVAACNALTGLDDLHEAECFRDACRDATTDPIADRIAVNDARDEWPGAIDAGADQDVRTLPPLESFPRVVTETLCRRTRVCCGRAPADWNNDGCVQAVALSKGPYAIEQFASFLDAGFRYDHEKARHCLDLMERYPCEVGATLTAQFVVDVRESCHGALVGTTPLDAPCRSTGECVSGYCADDDGGGRRCVPLLPVDAPCSRGMGGPNDPHGDFACTRVGIGLSPAAFCDSLGSGASNRCRPAQPLDASCRGWEACGTAVCSFADGLVCANAEVITAAGISFICKAGARLDAASD